MFSWLARWLDYQQDGDWVAYLWAPHNEHRIPVIRLLVGCDAHLFSGHSVVLVAASLTAVLATAAWACRVARAMKAATCWLAPMLVLTTANAVDVATPINCVFPLATAGVVCSILLFSQAVGWLGEAAALALALTATGCNAWGFAAWPPLIWMGWRRHSGFWALVVAAPLLAYGTIYYMPLWSPGATGAVLPAAWPARLWFLMEFAGLPVSRDSSLAPVGAMLGAALVLASLAGLAWQAEENPHRQMARALIAAGLTGALCVTVGRAGLEAAGDLPVRYSMLLLPLHLGLLFTVLPSLRMGAAVALASVLLLMQIAAAPPALRIAGTRALTLARFYAGHRDADMRAVVFPDLAFASRISAAIGKSPPERR